MKEGAVGKDPLGAVTVSACRDGVDLGRNKAITRLARPQLRSRGPFGCAEIAVVTGGAGNQLPGIRAGQDACAGRSVVKTTKSIATEHQEQRSKQTCNDGFEVRALPKRREMPQVLIVHDHPSEDGCGTSESIFPPGRLEPPLLSDCSSSDGFRVDGSRFHVHVIEMLVVWPLRKWSRAIEKASLVPRRSPLRPRFQQHQIAIFDCTQLRTTACHNFVAGSYVFVLNAERFKRSALTQIWEDLT